MTLAEFEKYAKEHNIFYCTKNILEQIRAEIAEIAPLDYPCDKRTPERIRDMALEIVEKYAEQEPTEDYEYEIECLQKRLDIAEYDKERLKEKIKALEQEPCDDVVSRQAVLKIIDGWYEQNRDTENIEDLIVLITYMDSVRPQEPKTGHWIEHPEIETSTPEYLMFYECSECGDKQCFYKTDIHKKRFCTNCGARMESEDKHGNKK